MPEAVLWMTGDTAAALPERLLAMLAAHLTALRERLERAAADLTARPAPDWEWSAAGGFGMEVNRELTALLTAVMARDFGTALLQATDQIVRHGGSPDLERVRALERLATHCPRHAGQAETRLEAEDAALVTALLGPRPAGVFAVGDRVVWTDDAGVRRSGRIAAIDRGVCAIGDLRVERGASSSSEIGFQVSHVGKLAHEEPDVY